MNSLILLCVVFTAVLGAPVNIRDTRDARDLLLDYGRECKEQSKIGIMALLGLASSDPPDNDEGYKNYMLCFLQKMGYLTSEAEYRDDTTDMEKWLSEEKAKSSLSDAKRLCGDRKGVRPADTASLIFRCFLKNEI